MADITIPGMFLTGDHASRPAATAVGGGSIYSCTDHALLYQSDGAAWSTWATLGGTAVTDATISTSDITTNNASTSKHGWLKKLSNVATEYMDGTGAWSTPAGGVALGAGEAEILTTPTIVNAEDDHFEGSSLNAKWLAYTGDDATPAFGTPDSWVRFLSGSKLQALPAGDWTIATEVIHGDHPAAAYTSCGLILTTGTTYGTSSAWKYGVGFDNSLTTLRLVIDKYVNGTYSSTPNTVGGFHPGSLRWYLRIAKVGSNYTFSYSNNRFTWVVLRASSTIDITPTHFGIHATLHASAVTGAMFNYFVRT